MRRQCPRHGAARARLTRRRVAAGARASPARAYFVPMSDASAPASPLLVACLCAGWCRTCDVYRETFDDLAQEFGARTRFVWVDIEDDDVLGALDIQNFPTLLLALDDEVRFFGTVTPQRQTARQLVQRALAAQLQAAIDPALTGLPARLRALR